MRVAVVAGRHGGFGGRLEGVAVRGGEEVAGLEVDGAAEEGGELGGFRGSRGGGVLGFGVVGGGLLGRWWRLEERYVGLELVRAVAEPHGVDVARGDEGELGTFAHCQ